MKEFVSDHINEANLPSSVDRQQQVLHSARFFEPYRAELAELFGVLGRQTQWSGDLRQVVSYTNRFWLGEKSTSEREVFTDEQQRQGWEVLDRVGFRQEMLPPEGAAYDQIVIIGGTSVANYRRFKLVLDQLEQRGVTTESINFWVGQRPRDKRDLDDDLLLAPDRYFAGNDIIDNPWVQQELAQPVPFDDETKLARLIVMKLVPNGAELHPYRRDLPVLSPRQQQVIFDSHNSSLGEQEESQLRSRPSRLVSDYRFTLSLPHTNGELRDVALVLLNGAAVPPIEQQTSKDQTAAVPRDGLNARHTTASCTMEWLERHSPSYGARVLLVAGNPYTLRTAQDTFRMVKNNGRGDIHFDIAGPNTTAAPLQSALGEVARLLYNDLKVNFSDRKEQSSSFPQVALSSEKSLSLETSLLYLNQRAVGPAVFQAFSDIDPQLVHPYLNSFLESGAEGVGESICQTIASVNCWNDLAGEPVVGIDGPVPLAALFRRLSDYHYGVGLADETGKSFPYWFMFDQDGTPRYQGAVTAARGLGIEDAAVFEGCPLPILVEYLQAGGRIALSVDNTFIQMLHGKDSFTPKQKSGHVISLLHAEQGNDPIIRISDPYVTNETIPTHNVSFSQLAPFIQRVGGDQELAAKGMSYSSNRDVSFIMQPFRASNPVYPVSVISDIRGWSEQFISKDTFFRARH